MNNIFVFDTNCLISASLFKNSTTRKSLDKAILIGNFAISNKTFDEFMDVIFCKKFDKYFISNEERLEYFNEIEYNFIEYSPQFKIADCRDPKDNKFLELAVESKATCIISGDADLLILHPFRGISILNPNDFLNNY